jgi:hypothetical protein
VASTYVINPRTDAVFVSAVNTEGQTVVSPADLERRLRPAYPQVVVHARQLDGEAGRVWYVYRDGHWIASD